MAVTTMPALDADSRLDLHPVVIRREDGQVIVGRMDTGDFVALPEVGGEAVELLADGRSIREAEEALAARHGAAVDLMEFAANVVELGFARALDGHPIDAAEARKPSLPWLRERHCRRLFALPARIALVAILLAGLLTLLWHPGLMPAPADFFWTERTSVVIAVNTLMVLAAVAVHEFSHLAAARSLGVPGRLSLGTRLHVLVAQTDVTGIWAVPRRRRYRVYLAGMAWDLSLLASVLMALAYVPMAGTLEALARALAVLLVLGLVGQLQLYMRTDVYFILADLLHARNLTEDAGAYVGSLARRAVRRVARGAGDTAARPDVLAALSSRERRAVRLYAPVMIIGSAVALALYARYGIPVLVELVVSAADSVWIGATEGDATRLIDGALTLGVEGGLQVLFVWVLLRNRGERVRAVWRRLASA